MGSFSFRELKTKEDKIGVWVRPSSICNTNLVNNLEKIGRVRFNETIERIIIKDVRNGCNYTCKQYDMKSGELVLLEIWLSRMTLRKFLRVIFNRPFEVNRYTVFTCWQPSSLDWVCEEDLGKGFPTEPQFYCVG